METKSAIRETALYNLEQTAKRLNIKDGIYGKLAEPKEKIEATIVPALSNGLSTIKVFVVRHSDLLGPSKGGIRMLPTVCVDDVVGLAMEMTWKTSLINVPFGGGKSGICADGLNLTPEDKETVVRAFTRGVKRHVGPELYVPAPDMGTNETDMGYIADCISYSNGTSITNGCFVTGKPVLLRGIVGRREATGKGVIYAIEAACERTGVDLSKTKVVVQGFGNVGSVAALEMQRRGAKVIAVSDIHGGIFNESGLDLVFVKKYVNANGSLKGFDNAEYITNKELLELECDILIPAASQTQITEENADNIKAGMIAEGANSPINPVADEILAKRGVFIIPDILCNAGGVFVSYLEYTQETQREQMTAAQVNDRLSRRMRETFDLVHGYALQNKLTMRESAMDVAVSRVVDAVYARGLLP